MTTAYTFKQENSDDEFQMNSSLVSRFEGDLNITQILEKFEEFLRGAGFFFDGTIQLVEENQYDEWPEDWGFDTSVEDDCQDEGTKSPYYYDFYRNKPVR